MGDHWYSPAPVGTLLDTRTGVLVTLDSHTLVGRGPNCNLRLSEVLVSSEHASIIWVNSNWVLRDLGSTNGTWIDGEAIATGRDYTLTEGMVFGFGGQNLAWRLMDAHPPEPMVLPLRGGMPCLIQDGVIAIPTAQGPVATIFQDSEGGWTLEVQDDVKPIQPGSLFDASGSSWRFSCPIQWQPTVPLHAIRMLEGCTLLFRVSRDEESVAVKVETDRESVDLGGSNAYYMLLTLARLRMREAKPATAEAGWVHRDELARMLRCDQQLLNVWICRVRAKLSAAGFVDYSTIVERRDGSGLLRIGVANCIVQRS